MLFHDCCSTYYCIIRNVNCCFGAENLRREPSAEFKFILLRKLKQIKSTHNGSFTWILLLYQSRTITNTFFAPHCHPLYSTNDVQEGIIVSLSNYTPTTARLSSPFDINCKNLQMPRLSSQHLSHSYLYINFFFLE